MTNSKKDPTKKLDDVLSRFLSDPPKEKDPKAENNAPTGDADKAKKSNGDK